MTDEELQSKSIDFLRFPLIVGVVLIHAHFSNVIMNGVNVNILHEYSCPIYDTTSYFFSELIGRIAVPLLNRNVVCINLIYSYYILFFSRFDTAKFPQNYDIQK